MEKVMLKNCMLDKEKIQDAIAVGIFGSYHEDCFNKDRSDIDMMIFLILLGNFC